MSCRMVRRHVGAMVDGELDPATQIEFERHVAACAPCQEGLAFETAMRAQVREALRGPRAPESLRGRVLAALDAEPEPGAAGATEGQPGEGADQGARGPLRVFTLRWRYAAPLAAAAAAAAVLLGPRGATGPERASEPPPAAMAGASSLLEDVVRLHSHRLPADVRGPEPTKVVRYFNDKVGFPVRTAEFGRNDVSLTGARLAHVRDRRAAALYYDVRGRRMTVVVFEPPTAAPAPGQLRSRLGGRSLYYQQFQDHVVPVRRHQGLTYALTGDLPRRQLLSLASSFQVR
jgi:anti-sigma factor (TIGR02949 family)